MTAPSAPGVTVPLAPRSTGDSRVYPSAVTLDPVDESPAAPSTSATSPPASMAPFGGSGVVPILYYHRIQAPPAGFAAWSRRRQATFLAYDVIPEAFAAQLDWLAENGYTTILPRDLAAHWDRGLRLAERPVILTFDDGFHDWVTTVLPLLRARHMVAEFYLSIDAIRSGAISWRDVRKLAAAGNGIGAHGVHHVQLAGFGSRRTAASTPVMWSEVAGARRLIQKHVGAPPDSMAYVGGGYDTTLMALVRKAGYSTARSIVRGIVQSVSKRYELRVVRIGSRDDVVNVLTGELVPGLPTFVARIAGVSDRARSP